MKKSVEDDKLVSIREKHDSLSKIEAQKHGKLSTQPLSNQASKNQSLFNYQKLDSIHNSIQTLDHMPQNESMITSCSTEHVKLPSIRQKNLINLTWKDLSVKLPAKSEWCVFLKKRGKIIDGGKFEYNNTENSLTNSNTELKQRGNVIDNVSGYAQSGDVLAIMGASGAGKTTLLNALTLRNKGDFIIEGDIKVNGESMKSFQDISAISGYVQQDDLFFGYLTVREHLIFQAMLRMNKGTREKERLERVDEVIHQLNLLKCEKNLIGLFGRKGISGGEKRRLAFAAEIITDPGILFCDEPTSGLDSYMAVSIMETMSALSRRGKTIICTIHQPSSRIFESFDKLCLMVEGKVAYFGHTAGAKDFFASQGYNLPLHYNPADYYIEKLAIVPNEKEKSIETIKNILVGYEASALKKKKLETIEEMNSSFDADAHKVSFRNKSIYKSNALKQLRWLLWRNMMAIIREPFSFQVQIIQAIIVSLLFGAIYFNLKYNSSGIQNINGFIFLCLTNNGFSTMFFVVASFPHELPIFLREHRNGMYRVLTYYIAKITIDLPTFTLVPIIFMSIAYWMANLNNNFERYVIAVVIIILVVQCSLAFGTFLSAIAPSVNIALAFAGPVLVPLMVFSGFLLNFDDIPDYFVWLRYFSWFSYANENLMLNQWEGVGNMTRLKCETSGFNTCVFTGDDVIAQGGWKDGKITFNYILLVTLILFYRIITYIALLIRAHRNSG